MYRANCQACHGVNGDPDTQIKIVLHGLSGKMIGGVKYGGLMPAFASQLNDAQIAAAIDHERLVGKHR